jgi:F0F1-type ATP synthase assembly protein I
MLWIIAVILFVLWGLGEATSYTAYGFIHLLLAVAIIVMLVRVFQGRRPVL